MNIEVLPVSKTIITTLKKQGYKNIEDLQVKPMDYTKISGIGETKARMITEALRRISPLLQHSREITEAEELAFKASQARVVELEKQLATKNSKYTEKINDLGTMLIVINHLISTAINENFDIKTTKTLLKVICNMINGIISQTINATKEEK